MTVDAVRVWLGLAEGPEDREPGDLPWATMPWPLGRARCRARLEPNPSTFAGRCQLELHNIGTDHAVTCAGRDVTVRWSTQFTAVES